MTNDTPITPEELQHAERVLRRFPKTRGKCPPSHKPCPYIHCRYHLWTGFYHYNQIGTVFRDTPVFGDNERTCALRFADTGPHTLEFTAIMLGVTRERVRQIEMAALKQIRERDPGALSDLLQMLNMPSERDTSATDWADPVNDDCGQEPEEITFSPRLNAILKARKELNNVSCRKGQHARRQRSKDLRLDGDGADSEPATGGAGGQTRRRSAGDGTGTAGATPGQCREATTGKFQNRERTCA